MILKAKDASSSVPSPDISADRRIEAGRQAELQMAHYLERAFGTSESIFVLNDLRLTNEQSQTEGDAAQTDHLIVHRWGFIVVESKSVTGRVRVNRHGEWVRAIGYDRNAVERGMPSPILQAQRQGRFLQRLLDDNADKMLGKILGLVQCHFGSVPLDVLVAISDQAIIERGGGIVLPEVCKADQIPGAAKALIEQRKKAASPLNLNFKNSGIALSSTDVDRICRFLLERHTPQSAAAKREPVSVSVPELVTSPVVPQPSAATTPVAEIRDSPAIRSSQSVATPQTITASDPFQCRHCAADGARLSIAYGRFGYYFKCAACDGNTPIPAVCSHCQSRARVRKEGALFYLDCATCDTATHFFTNG